MMTDEPIKQHSVIPTDRVTLVAHRGNADEFHENTITALRSAIVLGAKYIEVDVQMTLDGVPVLHHDHRISIPQSADPVRLKGEFVDFSQVSYSQIHALQPHLSYPIHHLHDLTALMLSHPDVVCFIDVKNDALAIHSAPYVLKVIKEIVAPIIDRVVIITTLLGTVHSAGSVQQTNDVAFPHVGWVLPSLTQYCIDQLDQLYEQCANAHFLFCDIEEVKRNVNAKENVNNMLANGFPMHNRFVWVVYGIKNESDVDLVVSNKGKMIETKLVRDILTYVTTINNNSEQTKET